MYRYLIIILLAVITIQVHATMTSLERSNAALELIKLNCGNDFVLSTASYCASMDKFDAKALLATLCNQ